MNNNQLSAGRLSTAAVFRQVWKPALLFFFLLAAGCGSRNTRPAPGTPAETSPTTSTALSASLPPPVVRTVSAPHAEATAGEFLRAWEAEDYPAMYALLSAESRQAISDEDFAAYYRNVAIEAALNGIETQILSSQTQTRQAHVTYQVLLHSVLVGDLQRETAMELVKEDGQWRVKWDHSLILPELSGGKTLRMEYRAPERGLIYDREGGLIAGPGEAVAVGLNTGEVDEEQEQDLLAELRRLFGVRPEVLVEQIENYRRNAWYLAVGDMSAEALAPREGVLARYSGVTFELFFSPRYYFEGGLAPHLVGYASAIQQDEVDFYKRLGYNVWSERVGRAGLELWGEEILSGKRGGVLSLVDPDGVGVTRLVETPAEPAQEIYTTIDRDLQLGVQRALGNFRGAIVVLERDTGRVLAMVSSPPYNPNLFDPNNFNRPSQIDSIFDPATTPRLNRATQGLYPLGSVFKIITLAAALESGLYTPESEYYCDYSFTELQGITLYDWTYERFLEDEETLPSGQLTLPEGLMRSCNPFFWHIGLDLYNRGMITTVSDMAGAFGLGSKTGIEIEEEAGNVPVPGDRVNATSLAVGQGDTLVTPLQVADFIAAVGNGGTLFRPSAVERIVAADGRTVSAFAPQVRGILPVSQDNLRVIQDAMISVVRNSRGTAYPVLSGFSRGYRVPVAGKTGTAETGIGEPHAWFTGYTYANREDLPDVAVVVVVESVGEGSEFAAPVFRRVLEIYFTGGPRTKYPWEEQIGILKTPEPEETPTVEVTPEE